MAMMDDAGFLINHIRNSFITSDDTGMSELVIDLDDSQAERASTGTDIRPTTWHGTRTGGDSGDSGLESDTELAHSVDIHPDMGFDSHRRRSNTAQRLEKLKVEKHRQSKIKHIQWKEICLSKPDDAVNFFEKKAVAKKDSQVKRASSLSVQMEQFATIQNNPFMEYAKFDGKTTAGIPTKKIGIYLTMAPQPERSYPMLVVTLATAKVQDLIGLICWQYAQENRQPPFKAETVEAYALHIAEDDGEVDTDFPALDPKETFSKFGFNQLALVEKEVQPQAGAPKSSVVVTINMPGRGFAQIPIETESVLMRDLLEKVLKKRKLRQDKGRRYILEKQNEPGVVIDLDSPLSTMDTLDFCLIRENSTRGDIEIEEGHEGVSALAESLSSHQYRSYVVSLVNKIRTNTEVQLGVSGEKIEIDPVSGKGILFKQKAVTYEIESIASCILTDQRASGKSTFRMVYLGGAQDFKHHDFECDTEIAEEIVKKVNNILEMRSSPVRKDYIAQRERKMHKRHTLSFS